MTETQLFFAITGVTIGVVGIQSFWIKNYIDSKIDGMDSKSDAKFETINSKFETVNSKIDHISKQVDILVQFMIDHEGRIQRLEERTKNL